MHAHNDRRFSKYFSKIIQLWSIYKQYSSDYRAEQANKRANKIQAEDNTVVAMMRNMQASMEAKMDAQAAELNSKLDRTREQLDLTNTKHDLAAAKLDVAESRSKQQQMTTDQILKRVSNMSREFWRLKDYAIDKSIKSTINPTSTNLRHGFAITTKAGTDRESGEAMLHFGIIAGQRSYVEKTVVANENEEQRERYMGFTYNANPVDYRNNVMEMIQTQLEEVAAQVNESFITQKKIDYVKRANRIVELEKKRADAGKEFELRLLAWKNPKAARVAINQRIAAKNAENLALLTIESRAHNLHQMTLPVNQRVKRNASRA